METDTRSLDAELAEALGWVKVREGALPWRRPGGSHPGQSRATALRYSTDGNASDELLDEMQNRGWRWGAESRSDGEVYFWFRRENKSPIWETGPRKLAIATAALIALTGETDA